MAVSEAVWLASLAQAVVSLSRQVFVLDDGVNSHHPILTTLTRTLQQTAAENGACQVRSGALSTLSQNDGVVITLGAILPRFLPAVSRSVRKRQARVYLAVLDSGRDWAGLMALRHTGAAVVASTPSSIINDCLVAMSVVSPTLLGLTLQGASSTDVESLGKLIGVARTLQKKSRPDESESTPVVEEGFLKRRPVTAEEEEERVKVLEELFSELDKSGSGSSRRLIEVWGPSEAETVVLTSGLEGDQHEIASAAESTGSRILNIRLLRPWVLSQVQSWFSYSAIRRVFVLEHSEGETNPAWGPLFADLTRCVASSLPSNARIFPLRLRNPTTLPRHITTVLSASFDPLSTVVVDEDDSTTGNTSSSTAVTRNASGDQDENVPSTVTRRHEESIKQAVGGDVVILSHLDDAQARHSAEYLLGKHIAEQTEREQLLKEAREMSFDASLNLHAELRRKLEEWASSSDEISANDILEMERLLEKGSERDTRIKTFWERAKGKLVPKRLWLVGGDEWAQDIAGSGMHNVLRSGARVSVLIVHTRELGDSASLPVRDLGLYAMMYGNTYVGSIAVSVDYTHALGVLSQAHSFSSGPSLVLAYAPIPVSAEPAVSANPVQSLLAAKTAVDSGRWPLYRFDPTIESASKRFLLHSPTLRRRLELFLQRENRLAALSSPTPSLPPASLSEALQKEQRELVVKSFTTLVQNLEASDQHPPLLLAFGSDGGAAEGVARKLEKEAKRRGMRRVRCASLDQTGLDLLAREAKSDCPPVLVVVVSTAGQGEFPSNAREFWDATGGVGGVADDAPELAGLRYAVFAMGDRNYWPHPGEEHFFCKAGKDLDQRLHDMKAERLVAPGLGDDQDPDGFNTALQNWLPELWETLGIAGGAPPEEDTTKLPDDDTIKRESNYLRGTIAEGLLDTSTGALALRDTKLTKFHGIYQQDDRDLRELRRLQGQERAYSFMVRIRVPGGIATAKQWLDMDALCDRRGNGTFKLTTRQAFQLHGIVKGELKKAIQDINASCMDTIAACGDVNRNVMCDPCLPFDHDVQVFARRLSEHLTPRTSAYHEIWMDKKIVAGGEVGDTEPLYGPTYLPRKFKIAIAVPPHNDVDVFAHCLGFVAIMDNNKLEGFNISVGGGMGMTHGNLKTYPRLADVLGFCTPSQALEVAEKVMLIQRDNGERLNRKHARLKYTIEDMGVEEFLRELTARCGFALEPARPYELKRNGDVYGWHTGVDGRRFYTLWIQNGRLVDTPTSPVRRALREIALLGLCDFRLTANQSVVLGGIKTGQDEAKIQEMIDRFGLDYSTLSGLRKSSIACVALPTCSLALAESERYLPELITKIEEIIDECGLRSEDITIRMSGCPNGCSRPYIAEIAFVGRAPGIYNMYLGGGFAGERLNKLYKDSASEETILKELRTILPHFAKSRLPGEHLGDFVIREKYVKATISGATFHDLD